MQQSFPASRTSSLPQSDQIIADDFELFQKSKQSSKQTRSQRVDMSGDKVKRLLGWGFCGGRTVFLFVSKRFDRCVSVCSCVDQYGRSSRCADPGHAIRK
jgi:hypothetical protein